MATVLCGVESRWVALGSSLKLCVFVCVLIECIEIMLGGCPAEHHNALMVIRLPHNDRNEQCSEVEVDCLTKGK